MEDTEDAEEQLFGSRLFKGTYTAESEEDAEEQLCGSGLFSVGPADENTDPSLSTRPPRVVELVERELHGEIGSTPELHV